MQICQASKFCLLYTIYPVINTSGVKCTQERRSLASRSLSSSRAQTTSNIAGTECTNRQRMRVRYRRKRRITSTGSYLSLHLPSWARSAPRTTP